VKFAAYEAEALCAYLVKKDIAFAAITHDTDIFAYACPRSILQVSTSLSQGRLIVFDDLLKDLHITEDTFQKACVLCGNDFCLNEKNVGPVRAFTQTESLSVNETVLQIFQSFCYQDKCLVHDEDQRESKRIKMDSPKSLCRPGSPNESPSPGLSDKQVSNETSETGATSS
jgi:5'-3' exonuclease